MTNKKVINYHAFFVENIGVGSSYADRAFFGMSVKNVILIIF